MTKKFSGNSKRKSFRKKTFTKPKSSKAFVKKVQKIIHADVETKQAYHILAPTNFNSGIDVTGDVIRVLPNISTGTDSNNRIGQELKAQHLVLKGCVSWSPSVGTFGTFANARLGVRLMVVQPRNYSQVNDVITNATTWLPNLLQKGVTSAPFTGQINDLWAPINTEAIIKYYDKVIMLNGTYQASNVGFSQLLGGTKFFTIKMKCRNKTLKYDQNISTNNPTNYAPVFLIGYAHLDGSGPDTVSTAITCQWDSIFNYEDA